MQFYALSIERKIRHPAVAAIVQNARAIFAEQVKSGARPAKSKRRNRVA